MFQKNFFLASGMSNTRTSTTTLCWLWWIVWICYFSSHSMWIWTCSTF